jgi:Flp pilus assembly protein TadG
MNYEKDFLGGIRPQGRRDGQALVEFALVLPLLLLLVFGLIDFARAWSANHAIADATREGARMLVVNEGSQFADAEELILQRLAAARLNVSADRLQVWFRVGDDGEWVTSDSGADPAGHGVPQGVRVAYAYAFWMVGPLIGLATGDRTISLVSTITMRGE